MSLFPAMLDSAIGGHEEQSKAGRQLYWACQLTGWLAFDQAELVPLAEEVRAVKEYLALEMVRFEQRLQARWQIAADASGVPVPPMLLQSLVENALKHGIARRPHGGQIVISADVESAELQLEVQNSGNIGGKSPDGVGLRNARQRLNLLYGAGATLALEDTGAGWVRARVNLPTPEGVPQ